MSHAQRKPILIAAALVVAAMGTLIWSYGFYDDQRSAAIAEVQDLASCRDIAGRIGSSHGVAKQNSLDLIPAMDLTHRIALAATAAGLSHDSVQGIRPDSVRRATAGNFLEKPTRLVIHHATLHQVTTLLSELDQRSDGLRVDNLHFSSENDPRDADKWTVDVMLIYSFPDDGKTADPSKLS